MASEPKLASLTGPAGVSFIWATCPLPCGHSSAVPIDALIRRAGAEPHHVSPYRLRHAQEASLREDNRRVDNGNQVRRVATLALGHKPSVDFSGY